MKLLPLLLAGSFAANAALVVTVWRQSPADRAVEGRPGDRQKEEKQRVAEGGKSAERLSSEKAFASELGGLVEQADLKTLVERLRAAGFSPSMVRWIVTGKLQEQMAARLQALQADRWDGRYWSARRNPFDSKLVSESRAAWTEYNDQIKQLLGADALINPMESAMMKHRYGDLPPDKLRQLQRVTSDYDELRSQIHASTQGMMLAEDREKLAFIDKEQQADLARLLSPEEYLNYELRSSALSSMLKSRIGNFEVSEAEFRQLFAAAKAAAGGNSGLGFGGFASPGLNLSGRNNVMLETAKTMMTPERYAEFEIATDPQYSAASRLAARLNLPAAAVQTMVTVQREGQQALNEIRSNRQLTPEQRTAQLAALNQQVTQKLSTVLDERGLAAYKETAGAWLRGMTMPAMLPSRTGTGSGAPVEIANPLAPRG